MSDRVLCDKSDLVEIADAVRSFEGNTGLYSFSELKEKAKSIVAQAGNSAELPELSNPATESDVLSGKEFIDADGNKVTGNIATVAQATPSISISSAGKITASATQTAGYVAAGTKSGTKQMTVQAAKTVTPSTSSQTAVAKNVYTTGVVTVAAIPSQYEDITTPLADLNAANGGTEATTIAAAVDNTEAYANTQEALIAQIASALEGKAAGGSGSASLETGTLNGVTTMAAEPTGSQTTYYYDLGGIPNITSKRMIYLRDATYEIYLFLLVRTNLDEQFATVENIYGNSAISKPTIVVTDYVMSLTTSTATYSSLYYYAV